MDDNHHFELTCVFVTLRDRFTKWFARKEGVEVRTTSVKLSDIGNKPDYQMRSMQLM